MRAFIDNFTEYKKPAPPGVLLPKIKIEKKFIKKDKKNGLFFKKTKDKNYFSLGKYIHHQLKALDIKNIDVIKKDTFVSKNNFFSARRSIRLNENDYGRNISVIMIN